MLPTLDCSRDLDPPLAYPPLNVDLADWIVYWRLFAFFFCGGCVPLNQDHAMMERMTSIASSPSGWDDGPFAVWGYDDTLEVMGGSVFEAETLCSSGRNLGQIALSGVSNLPFSSFSSLT